MGDDDRSVTRREFMRTTAGAAIAGATGAVGAGELAAWATEPSPGTASVVLVRDEAVLDANGQLVSEVLVRMLDRAVAELIGAESPAAAWRALFQPSDTVGVKSNVWRFLRTPEPLEEAIRTRLVGAGVRPTRIAIDDRGVRDNPLFRDATALINVRPMRTHHWSGVGSLLKNYIMFSPNPPDWHPDSCADLGGLWKLPVCAGKTRLNVLVMLTPLFHSQGPHDFNAKYTWPYKGLIVSADPVAADATGLRILEAKRREHFGEDLPFEVPPKHIRVAADKFGLGVADPARIRLTKLGWSEGVLV